MSDDISDDLFLQEMQGVKPLKAKRKVNLVKKTTDKATVNIRRQAAE